MSELSQEQLEIMSLLKAYVFNRNANAHTAANEVRSKLEKFIEPGLLNTEVQTLHKSEDIERFVKKHGQQLENQYRLFKKEEQEATNELDNKAKAAPAKPQPELTEKAKNDFSPKPQPTVENDNDKENQNKLKVKPKKSSGLTDEELDKVKTNIFTSKSEVAPILQERENRNDFERELALKEKIEKPSEVVTAVSTSTQRPSWASIPRPRLS